MGLPYCTGGILQRVPLRAGLISYHEALLHCSNPSDSELKVRGIASTSDARWDNFEKSDGDSGDDRRSLDIERF
jgi:hypothetical protein